MFCAGCGLCYEKEALENWKIQFFPQNSCPIDSILHKLRETVKTLEGKEQPARYRSQITLARRRIEALEIANLLIEDQMRREQ